MPLEDAISLLARNFDSYLLREKASRPSEVNVVPAAGPLTAVNLTDRHPEAIQVSIPLHCCRLTDTFYNPLTENVYF